MDDNTNSIENKEFPEGKYNFSKGTIIHDSYCKICASFKGNPLWIGNCIALWYDKSNPKFIIGPHWKLYLISNILIIGFSIVFFVYVNKIIPLIGIIIGIIILIAQVICHAITAFINPGIPDRSLSK